MGGGASLCHDGDSFKSKGDACFRIGQNEEAIYWYTIALSSDSLQPDDKVAISILYSNRSAAFSSNGQHEKSLSDALQAVDCRPDWSKAYYRAACASLALLKLAHSREYLIKALALSPSDETLINLDGEISKAEVVATEGTANAASYRGVGWAYSWGCGENAQLGLGLPLANKSLPTVIDFFRGKYIASVTCGAMHTVAISSMGEVFTWGNNEHSQLGYSTENNSSSSSSSGSSSNSNSSSNNSSSGSNGDHVKYSVLPRLVTSNLLGVRIVAVAAGAGHSIVISDEGIVYGWGINRQGQLGLNMTNNVHQPTVVTALKGKCVAAVSCGLAHTVFLLNNGSIECCGLNSFGQLGLETLDFDSNNLSDNVVTDIVGSVTNFVTVPIAVKETLLNFKVSHIACGAAHTLLIDTEGLLYSAGSDSCGQLGRMNSLSINMKAEQFNLVTLPFHNTKCAYVACGEEFSCLVTRGRSVFMWGLGIAGQMGDGKLTGYSSPRLVVELEGEGIDSLSCSQGQILAMASSGDVWTWGLPGDRAHLVSYDTSAIILKPEKVAAFSRRKKIQQVACGRKHYILLTTGMYGPYCYVKTGFYMEEVKEKGKKKQGEKEDEMVREKDKDKEEGNEGEGCIYKAIAGQKIKFTIQGKDYHNDICSSGGSVFQGIIDHESIDYEIKYNRQINEIQIINNNDHNNKKNDMSTSTGMGKLVISNVISIPIVNIDDNMDGTYDSTFSLQLSGDYRISILLHGEHINGSPFHTPIVPDRISPRHCRIWWGKLIKTNEKTKKIEKLNTPRVQIIGGKNGGEGSWTDSGISIDRDIQCVVGESIIFTVSCYDKYGNKCIETHGYSISAIYSKSNVKEGRKEGNETKGEKQRGDARDGILRGEMIFVDSKSGVFPCAILSPSEVGIYNLNIRLINNDNDINDDISDSPYRLTVIQKVSGVDCISQNLTLEGENAITPDSSSRVAAIAEKEGLENIEKNEKDNEKRDEKDENEEKDKKEDKEGEIMKSKEYIDALFRQETTRRRARDALLKQQAMLSRQRDEERKNKAIKRTGGGFIIQYSKEI